MAVVASDVKLLLSGGVFNTDPDQSLGGESSAQELVGVINNLFDDISDEENEDGRIDYRAIYISNENLTDTWVDVQVQILAETEGGASIQLGISTITDQQNITLTGTSSGGSFTISYEGDNVVVAYDAVLATWASNLQTGLNGLASLSGVVVSASESGSIINFEVTFEGDDDNRNHELIVLVVNAITGSPTIDIEKIQAGAPVNSLAPCILPFDTTPPTGVDFSDGVLSIGDLQAGDDFPLWMKRTTEANVDPVEADGFSLRITGSG